MYIGLSLSPFGHHPSAWRRHRGTGALGFQALAAQVKLAERAALDFVFLPDLAGKRPQRALHPEATPFEPTLLISALATVTRKIGLVGTALTTQHEPYNLARRFASLDLISHGRTGWNLAPGDNSDRAGEYVQLVQALWQSWDADAFLYDKQGGRFFDPAKMHVLDHKGEYFTVRGPLNVNPSPQGAPVIAATVTGAAQSPVAGKAELILVEAATIEETIAIADRLRSSRNGPEPRIFASIAPHIAASMDEAEALRREFPMELPELVGTPETIADRLAGWQGNFDGFLIHPPLAPDGVQLVMDGLVPALRRRGLFRDGYEADTLRGHLGLAAPAIRPGGAR